jgi:plastocyanin
MGDVEGRSVTMNKILAVSALALACLLSFSCSDSGSDSPDADAPREIVFTTLGASFAPMIEVDAGATVRWTWADGTTSAEANPSKDYGSPGVRKNRLLVTPWSALTAIDIGYDGGDGGSLSYERYRKEDQHVSAVENLDLARDGLVVWCSSYNNIPILDFSSFRKLETIECFYSNSLCSVNLADTPALKRACFEDCDLMSLDLTGCPNLEDLRGAVNDYPTIVFGPSYPRLWHICVRDNGGALTDRDIFGTTSAFPAIRELFIWNDNQAGTLRVPATGAGRVEIAADGNGYVSADFTGALADGTESGTVLLRNNRLTAVTLTGCDQICTLDLANNELPQGQVDSVLGALDGFGRPTADDGGLTFAVDLSGSGNASPGADGESHASNLRARGWSVTVN